jgi:hypothetical protein
MRAWAANGELFASAFLFLVCAYAAIFFVLSGALATAGFCAFCAVGFFQAASAFHDAAVMREAMGLGTETEGGEG